MTFDKPQANILTEEEQKYSKINSHPKGICAISFRLYLIATFFFVMGDISVKKAFQIHIKEIPFL